MGIIDLNPVSQAIAGLFRIIFKEHVKTHKKTNHLNLVFIDYTIFKFNIAIVPLIHCNRFILAWFVMSYFKSSENGLPVV